MMSWDESRSVDLKLKLLAEDEWNLHRLNMKYYKYECTEERNNPRYVLVPGICTKSVLSFNDVYIFLLFLLFLIPRH